MGITAEVVRNVFSKSRSARKHDSSNVRRGEKKKWRTSVRSYLCGDEFNSVLAEGDSASLRSPTTAAIAQHEFTSATSIRGSKATSESGGFASEDQDSASVNQPLHLLGDLEEEAVVETDENPKEKLNSTYNLFQQDDAAIIIQSAFRSFLARRSNEAAGLQGGLQELAKSPSRESIGTSVEVQTADSSDIFSFQAKSISVHDPLQCPNRTQVLKLQEQEDWDDSTVSSVVSKMRIQKRLEAARRRERALAYAFSQQLRICSKKKLRQADQGETNIGWSWLERWMATRQQPGSFSVVERINKMQMETVDDNQSLRWMDLSVEEKESCGSNEVSLQLEVEYASAREEGVRPHKNKTMAIRNFSRKRSALSHL